MEELIGIIGAMDVEMAALKDLLENARTEEISGVTFYRGQLAGKETVLAVCGIGKTFAALCAEAMILRYAPAAILNIGVAGTLTEKLSIGDMAIGSGAVCHDMDTSPLGDPVGLISGLNMVEIPLAEDLRLDFLRLCADCGISAFDGVIASGDQFISDPVKKSNIRRTFGAIACEMEGQAIAQVCYVNRTPCAILRSISDNADGDSMDYLRFKNLAAEHSVKLIVRWLQSRS